MINQEYTNRSLNLPTNRQYDLANIYKNAHAEALRLAGITHILIEDRMMNILEETIRGSFSQTMLNRVTNSLRTLKQLEVCCRTKQLIHGMSLEEISRGISDADMISLIDKHYNQRSNLRRN